ncbi:hypothetical protein KQX54_006610 [Cotesia glomerata]|uniref:Uncharacterized protein n=2 Tax=Cotesia glomerata TaxID=32391 RepID=A0AAV7ID78_COTGL|nr:hypothetical protein KQX54_006610 [Cotesia glomerata]
MGSNVELIILNEPPAPKLNYIYQEYVPTRVIELSDYKTKLDLRREFNIDHETAGTSPDSSYKKCNYNPSRSLFNIDNNVVVPKLPAGTIIVKKEDKKPKLQSRNASNIESIIGKIKSMKKMDKTKTEVQRVPLQGVKKKNDDNFSRLRLLAAKRRDCRNDGGIKKKQLKKCNVPYMNTRSITKKLYNVGAAYQPPTVSDEMEWKEWPVHGMHERPIYHPQIGLGTEFFGRCFVNADNNSYKQVSSAIGSNMTNNENRWLCKKRTYSRDRKTKSKEEKTFAHYMHDSLHYVLGFCAQVMTPEYKTLINKQITRKSETVENIISKSENSVNFKAPLASLKGSTFFLQEVSSTSGEVSKLSPNKLFINFKNIKNHEKLQQALESGSKNTLILLKTTIPAVKKETSKIVKPEASTSARTENFTDGIVVSDNAFHGYQEKYFTVQTNKTFQDTNSTEAKVVNFELLNGNWINELIEDTAMIYCVAAGVHQDDLISYIDTLDADQSINWLMSKLE